MDKRKILIQLDTDAQPSVFDRVVAIDAGVDELFSYGNVQPDQVQALVHGAIFTRSPKSLRFTALFIGGSDAAAGEMLLSEARRHMIPKYGLQVSVLLDSNGANTTAAAAVHLAGLHLDLKHANALVLGGTGPVGQRVALLLARQGADVRIGSRQEARAAAVGEAIRAKVSQARLSAVATAHSDDATKALAGRNLVVTAGAAGVVLLPRKARATNPGLQVVIDLNAVPPLGVEGIDVTDKATPRDGALCYGAVGVGETKMKIHRAAVARLFESNDQVLDAEDVFTLASSIS